MRGKTVLTPTTAVVGVEGVAGVHEMLRKWADPKTLETRNRNATRAAAKLLAKPLRAEARAASSRMGKSVYIHQKRGDRTATIVGHHRKVSRGPKGDFWPMVIGGTKDHGPRKAKFLIFTGSGGETIFARRVRGVRPNPIVARVAQTYGERAIAAMIAELEKGV
jgi:hypothetical protein